MSLGALFGPRLTFQLSLVQAYLIISLADTIPVIPTLTDGPLFEAAQGGGKAETADGAPSVPPPGGKAPAASMRRASLRPQKGTDDGE